MHCTPERFAALLQCVWRKKPSPPSPKDHCADNAGEGALAIAGYLNQYLSAWSEIIGKPMRFTYSTDWIVQQAFYSSFDDSERKYSLTTFYVANINCIRAVILDLLKLLKALNRDSTVPLRHQRCFQVLHYFQEFAAWAIELMQAYGTVAGATFEPLVCINKLEHHRDLYSTCCRLWYGDFVQHPWATAVMVRQSIEIRLRRAMNIQAVVIDGNEAPVPITRILDALSHERAARSEIPWQVLRRVYQWTNIYVHTGAKNLPWLVGYAMQLLRPLMTGVEEQNGGWSVDNAIRISSDGIARVHRMIVDQAKRRDDTRKVKLLSFGSDLAVAVEG